MKKAIVMVALAAMIFNRFGSDDNYSSSSYEQPVQEVQYEEPYEAKEAYSCFSSWRNSTTVARMAQASAVLS